MHSIVTAIASDPTADVNHLIMETLSVIRDLVNNDQEPPGSLLKLNVIADKEEGWQMVCTLYIISALHTIMRSIYLSP